MTMSNELLFAILSLDSYNRGYGAGVVNEGATDQDGLGETGNIAGMTVITRADLEISAAQYTAWRAANFYAAAYQDSRGNIVICYRGTDDPIGDAATGWATGGGQLTVQAELAAKFYYQVEQTCPDANITLTGHSLGGGPAGFVAMLAGSTATSSRDG